MPEEALMVESDIDAREAALAALDRTPMVKEARPLLGIEVENGAATVTGIALSGIMRRAIIYTIAATLGINKVFDHMTDDTEICQAVAAALAAEPSLKDQPIKVTSYIGKVTLAGAPLGEADRARAKEIAARAPGVREVFIRQS